MKNARIVCYLLLSAVCVSAQILPSAKPASPPVNKDPLDRDAPQSSVVAFLEAAHANDFNKALRYFDLRNMPQDQRLSDGTELARQL